MKHSLIALISLLATSTTQADILELKDGRLLQGHFQGGTIGTVRFEVSGSLQVIPVDSIVALTFDGSSGTAAPPALAATAAASPPAPQTPAPASGPVTLPTGTILLVRMMDSVSSKNAPGANFTTKLEYDLVANGVVVAKRGTLIYGKVQSSSQARRAVGRSTLDLRLVQMVPNGTPVPISTSGHKEAGEASIRKVAAAAAVGAVIGNNTGSGSSEDGALIGAGVAMLKPGQTLTVPPGSVLEFSLTQPVTIR